MKKKLFSCAAVLLLLCVVLSAGILCRKKTIRKIGYKRDLRESVNFTLEELIPIAENDLTELGLMPDNFYQGGQSGYRMEKPNQSFLVLGRVFIGK